MPNKISGEPIEVGKEILSYCGKCKADSDHIISSVMEKDKIGKVMCRTCKAQHNYRKPKSLTTSKPLKKSKSASPKKSPKNPAKAWNDLLIDYNVNEAKSYSMKKNYESSSIINHSMFGIGVVTKKIDTTKIEVQFESGIKLLAINMK